MEGSLVTGVIALAFGILFLVLHFILKDPGELPGLILSSLMNLLGLGLWGSATYRLKGWRETRGRQMHGIALRALDRAERRLDPSSPPAAAPQLDLDALADEETPDAAHARSRRRTT